MHRIGRRPRHAPGAVGGKGCGGAIARRSHIAGGRGQTMHACAHPLHKHVHLSTSPCACSQQPAGPAAGQVDQTARPGAGSVPRPAARLAKGRAGIERCGQWQGRPIGPSHPAQRQTMLHVLPFRFCRAWEKRRRAALPEGRSRRWTSMTRVVRPRPTGSLPFLCVFFMFVFSSPRLLGGYMADAIRRTLGEVVGTNVWAREKAREGCSARATRHESVLARRVLPCTKGTRR